jgi:Retroviral aspartyl protease
MKNPDDNFIYNYMFLEGLNEKVQAEFMRMPDAIDVEEISLSDVLVLAKRAEQAAKLQSGTFLAASTPSGGDAHNKVQNKSSNKRRGYSKSSQDAKSSNSQALGESEKRFLKMNIERGGGLIVRRETQFKSAWREWARKEGVCSKCCTKGHIWKRCNAEEKLKSRDKGKDGKFNSIEMNSSDSAIEDDQPCSYHDVEYLFSLCQRRDSLMLYDCQINNCHGTVLTDCAATKNFISKDFALKSNVKFRKNTKPCTVKLPNGETMQVLGDCLLEITLSEWTGIVRATIIDMKADFDIVLGLEWMVEVQPIPDWATFDWYIPSIAGTLRIAHRSGVGVPSEAPTL